MNTRKYSAGTDIRGRVIRLRARVERALNEAGRQNPVFIVAVGKTQPSSVLLQAYQAGVRHFGENYLQESLGKQVDLAHCDITWHFIGPIQSNKTRPLAAHFHWVHSIDRLRIARRLSEQRPDWLPCLNVCLQVNVSGEANKAGVSPEAVVELAHAVSELPRLRLRGLMTLPAPSQDFEIQRASFRGLRRIRESLPSIGMDTLSMGMSDDLEAAIMEGATMVRVGTALFGPRRN